MNPQKEKLNYPGLRLKRVNIEAMWPVLAELIANLTLHYFSKKKSGENETRRLATLYRVSHREVAEWLEQEKNSRTSNGMPQITLAEFEIQLRTALAQDNPKVLEIPPLYGEPRRFTA
ncbi:MAG TPA: hypothetical protein VEF76_11580 [Patescibacteria group bacterium]|nr:hypothetical protein [Patescibacteria group bacterium]